MYRFFITYLVLVTFMGCSSSDAPTSFPGSNNTKQGGESDGAGSGDTGGGSDNGGSVDQPGPGGNTGGGNGGGPGDNGDGGFVDKDLELVNHITKDLVNPRIHLLRNRINLFDNQLNEFCAGKEVTVTSLQEAWTAAMLEFHYLEALAFGPLADESGKMASFIYSLPKVGASQVIDNEIEKAFEKQDDYKMKTPKDVILGFDALEYVLFARLETSELPARECAYTTYVSKDLKSRIDNYASRWQKEEILYLASPAGKASLKEYISEMTGGLVTFADKKLKDRKLIAPLGLRATEDFNCQPGVNCHEIYAEHPYSLLAKEALEQNVRALNDAFNGKTASGFGFNAYLKASEVALTSANASLDLPRLESRVGSLPGAENFYLVLDEFWVGDDAAETKRQDKNNPIYLTYVEVKKLTDWMKTDFVADLNTNLPGSVQGDND